MIDIKLSNNTNGVGLKVRTEDEALDIIGALLGAEGIKRITITYTPEDPAPVEDTSQPVEYPEQPCEVVATPSDNQAGTSIFTEIKPIHKKDLGKYIDLLGDGMGYNDQEDGRIVIRRGLSTKVCTNWKTIRALPYPVPNEMIKHLTKSKQFAIRNFRRWIDQGKPAIYRDPDADFRQILTTDTKPTGGGDFENRSGSYE